MPHPPNIVIVMTDQQRADFFKSEGFALDTMPFLDDFAKRGVRFRRAYSSTPLCSPARISMFSGRFPKATRVRENAGIAHCFGPDDLITVLKRHGYSINLAGKNHSHLRPEDFDFYSSYMHRGGGRAGQKTHQEDAMDAWLAGLQGGVAMEAAPFPWECQPPCRVVRDAMECIDDLKDDRPFFLWLSFAEPHSPYQVSEPYFSMFREEEIPERMADRAQGSAKGPKWRWMQRLLARKQPHYDARWRRYRATYCGMIRLIDDQIHRFMDHLAARRLLEKTIVIFLSDHGDFAGDYGLVRKGVEMPECLIRIPLIVAGPGIPARASPRDDFVSMVDVMPTLCEAIGETIPYGVQGRSLWPMLTGAPYPQEEFQSVYAELGFGGMYYDEEERPELHFRYEGRDFDCLNAFTMSGKLKMLRKGDWKLTYDMLGKGHLFHLGNDPAELLDLFEDPAYRSVRADLVEELLTWTIRTEDDLPSARYIPKQVDRNWYAGHRNA